MIYICDAMMGSGKSTAAINYIKEHGKDENFIYVTPFLKEVDRMCRETNCRQPTEPNKKEHVKWMLDRGINISTTHSMFQMFDKESMDLAKLNEYTLILDEVSDVVRIMGDPKSDIRFILDAISIDKETGKVTWIQEDYDGKRFQDIKDYCDAGVLYSYCGEFFLWMFPVDVFMSFKNVYVLTYMFTAQMQYYYYRLFGVEFKDIYVSGKFPKIYFTEKRTHYDSKEYKKLITIVDSEKLNAIGDDRTALSSSWYKRCVDNDRVGVFNKLKNNTYNFFRNITNTSVEENMWTVFQYKSTQPEDESVHRVTARNPYPRGIYYPKIKNGRCGGESCFVSVGMRATNEYRQKKALVYLVNVFYNPLIERFFRDKEIILDEDAYALSELLQWMFRSCIRDKKPITIYIPSRRMRTLLQNWINKE